MGWSGDNLNDNLPQYNAINQYMGEGGLDGQGDFVLYHAVVDNVFRFGFKDYNHLDYWTLQSQENYIEGEIDKIIFDPQVKAFGKCTKKTIS